MRLEPGRPAALAIGATLLRRRCCSAAALLVAVLVPAGLFAQAQDPPPIVQLEGTVAARRGGALEVRFEPRDGVVPRAGDLVSFSLEIDGIVAAGGSGSVLEVETDLVWVEVAAGRPDLGMNASISATGRVDPNAEVERLQRRALAGDCEGVRPALRRRADAGSPLAATLLGWLQMRGSCGARETEAGLELVRGAAEGGFARAMRGLSVAYGSGMTGAVDRAAAVAWARRAAATGDPWGSGRLYYEGKVIRRDREQAVRYLQRALELGEDIFAGHTLGSIYELEEPIDLPRAMGLYQRAAAAGSTAALYRLAWLHYRGEALERDAAQAARLLQRAIDLGDRKDAVALLGFLYSQGEGVPKDVAKALDLYRQAVRADSRLAHFRLGYHTYLGEGTPRDPSRAAQHLERAVELGSRDARDILGFLYERGDGVPRDLERALDLYREAAANGSRSAMSHLGHLYEEGLGVPRDLDLARSWYEKALPDPGAERGLARLRSRRR